MAGHNRLLGRSLFGFVYRETTVASTVLILRSTDHSYRNFVRGIRNSEAVYPVYDPNPTPPATLEFQNQSPSTGVNSDLVFHRAN